MRPLKKKPSSFKKYSQILPKRAYLMIYFCNIGIVWYMQYLSICISTACYAMFIYKYSHVYTCVCFQIRDRNKLLVLKLSN